MRMRKFLKREGGSSYCRPTWKIDCRVSSTPIGEKSRVMLESLLLPVERNELTFPLDLDEMINDRFRVMFQALSQCLGLVHQTENIMGHLEFLKIKCSEYPDLKKQLKQNEQSLKIAEERTDQLLAKDKLRPDFTELRSSFDSRLARALQDRVDEERSKILAEFKDLAKFKNTMDKNCDDGTESAFLQFARRPRKHLECSALQLPIADLSSCPPD